MQADLFKCSYCSESFDLELHLPKILISCHHCLCLKCLKVIFTLFGPRKRPCPICNVNLLSKFTTPEAYPNDPTIFHLLQSRPKIQPERDCRKIDSPVQQKLGDCTEIPFQQASFVKRKDDREEFFQDKVRKKLKTEQEIGDELANLQELITNQFSAMRKMLQTSNQKRSPSKSTNAEVSNDDSEFMIKEEDVDDHHQNEHPLAEIAKKLKGMFNETQEALDKLLKTNVPVEIEATETSEIFFQQIPVSSGNEEEEEEFNIKVEGSISLDDAERNYFDLKPEMENKVIENMKGMEEEFEEEEKVQTNDDEKNPSIEKENQIMEIEAKSQLKLDFSEKEISETTFDKPSYRIDKNIISSLEVDFSASFLNDQQFTKFVQNILTPRENLTSLMINLTDTRISSESLQVLSDQCLKNLKLKSFALNCSGTSIGYEGIKNLDDSLSSSVQTLENFEITLNSTEIQGEKFLDAIFGMEKLKNLKLSFEDSQISSEIVSSVLFCLSFLAQNLETLELNLNSIGVDDEGLGSFSTAVFHMEKLKHFKLCLGATFISNDFILDFFQSLSSIGPHLETLELDFHSTELSNRVFKNFCDGPLSEMKNIENLKLDLSRTKLTDMGLKSLILPSHKLQYLTLNLSENKIHDSGLKIFKENNNFKNIKSIALQVGLTDVTDEALQGFLNHVEKAYEAKAPLPLKKISSKDSADVKEHSNKESNPKNGGKEFIPRELDPTIKVFSELRKELVAHYNLKSQPSKVETQRVFKMINNLEPKVYDDIMRKILRNILSIEKVEDKEVEEWKKIIQAKIASSLANSSKKLSWRKKRGRNTEEKQNESIIIETKEDNSTIETEPNNVNIETEEQNLTIEKEQSDINIEPEQENKMEQQNNHTGGEESQINIEPEEEDNIKIEADYINIETEEENIDIKTEHNHINIKTELKIEQDNISTGAERKYYDIERSQEDWNTEPKQDILNIEGRENPTNQNGLYIGGPQYPSKNEAKQNDFHIERPQNPLSIQSHESAEGNPPLINIEAKQDSVHIERPQDNWNSAPKQNDFHNWSTEAKQRYFYIKRLQYVWTMYRYQKNFQMQRQRQQNALSTEAKQDSVPIERPQNTWNTEEKQSNFSAAEQKPALMNIEAKQDGLHIERPQNNWNTEAKQNNFSAAGTNPVVINIEAKQGGFHLERPQNNWNMEAKQFNFTIEDKPAERKPKIFNIEKNQKIFNTERKQNPINIVKEQNKSNNNQAFSQSDTMRDLLLSQEVFSFRWMKKYAKEIGLRDKVIEILKSMEYRSLPVLFQRLLEFIRELSKTYTTWKMDPKVETSAYASNWWSRFITADPEIKSIWKGFSSKSDSNKQLPEQSSEIYLPN